MQTQLDTEAEMLKQISNNPGIIQTYLKGMVPSLLSFLVQVVIAVLVLLIGSRIIKFLLKLIKKSLDRSRVEAGRCHISLLTREIFAVFCFGDDHIGTVWRDDQLSRGGARFCGTDTRSCFTGKPVEFRRRRTDPSFEAFCRRGLHR